MSNIAQQIHERYLDRIDDETWDDEDPRLDFGVTALPYFIEAFEKETAPEHRARLTRVIWQFRDPRALPTLAKALEDSSDDVWKDALDGIVTIGGDEAISILVKATAQNPNTEKRSWLDEAIQQTAKIPP